MPIHSRWIPLTSPCFALVSCIALAWVVGGAAAARADVFVLSNGGRVEGTLVNAGESPRTTYVIDSDGAKITLAKEQVKEVVSQSAAASHYEKLLPRMPASADGNWKMAEWCGKYSLADLRRQHLEKVIEYDPNHDPARRALGFSLIDGAWTRPEELMESRGYVRNTGTWRLPQEVALEEAALAAERDEKELRKRMQMWRTWVVKNRGQAQEGLQNFKQLNNPVAARGLADLIAAEDVSQMKVLLIETLGRLQTPLGVKTFAELAMRDANQTVRDAAIDQLQEFGGEMASPILVTGLSDKDNTIVNWAAIALGSIGDPTTTVPLIEALSTKHKFIINPNAGNTNVGFSNDGSGGPGTFTQGGGPKLIEQEMPNQQVLSALMAVHPGVNFQYNKQAWKDWFARQRLPKVDTLRRDP